MDRMVNFWMGDSFVVCLICGPLLVLGLFRSSELETLTADSPLTVVVGGVVAVGYQARGVGTGVGNLLNQVEVQSVIIGSLLDIVGQFREEVLSV